MQTSLESSVKKPEWVLVQPGLFHYPPPEGQEPALLVSRCGQCESHFFPRRSVCPNCFEKGKLEDTLLPRRGVVYASTVVQVPSPVGIKPPYAYGYVDIAANRIRVFALFTGETLTRLSPGRRLN
jgi:uncharacterized OB-fold protein